MISEPSWLLAMLGSCVSFSFYGRIVGGKFWRTLGYLGLLGTICAGVVTLYFGSQYVPVLRGAARNVTGFVLSGGRLVVAPDFPSTLYDDGSHGVLLARVAVDKEPAAPERRYDTVVTLRPKGTDVEFWGFRFHLFWPADLTLETQRLDAIAFMESWWPVLCMIVFATALVVAFVAGVALSLLGGLLILVLASASRETSLGRGFNLAAHALTPGTLVMLVLFWSTTWYRVDPLVIQWSWLPFVILFLTYLVGSIHNLPPRSARSAQSDNPWARPEKP